MKIGSFVQKLSNIQDFDMTMQKVSNIRRQLLVQTKVTSLKTYPIFGTFDQFLHDL